MNYKELLNFKIKEIKPSGIRRFFDIVAEMDDVISLGVGEPDFPTPSHIRDVGIQSLMDGHTKYTSNAGLIELRKAVAAYYERRFHVSYDGVKQAIITVGASEALDLCFRVLIEPGDEVLVPEPSFVCYAPLTTISDGVPVPIVTKEEDKFRLTPEALKAAITPKTKLLILPYPNNPTGAVFSRERLKQWVDYANRTDAVLLFDAAYEAFIEDDDIPHSIFEIEGARTCAIEICSLSKTAGFTGTRLGYTVIPKELERNGMHLNEMWIRNRTTKTNGVSYIIQKGGAAVFTEEGQKQIRERIQVYKKNAKVLMEALDRLGIWYCGGKNAPYIWMKCPKGMGSWEFFDYLLQEIQVVGTPGEGFGACGEGYFRFSTFGSPEDTKEAAERLVKLLG